MKDVLLYLSSYPRATPDSLIRYGINLAGEIGAHITAFVGDPDPIRSIDFYRGIESIHDESNFIHQTARNSLTVFNEETARLQLSYKGEIVTYTGEHAVLPLLLERARTHDLTLLPFLRDDVTWPGLAERLIFGSGRPVFVLPFESARPFKTGRVVVAWDFSRPAARALGDSISLLRRAAHVHVVTVIREKVLESAGNLEGVANHLLRHGIRADLEQVDAGNRRIGDVLISVARDADMLVMGAFGHSRIRDFVLGGATRSMLQDPPFPILLSY